MKYADAKKAVSFRFFIYYFIKIMYNINNDWA